MKTLDQILEYQNPGSLDGRDVTRLADFIPQQYWERLGLRVADGVDPATIEVSALTRYAVLERLRGDLSFAFEKALGQRGISASLMRDVIKMWVWVLDDQDDEDLRDALRDERYAQYGLPLLKAVALKYGFENEIGNDDGDEGKYAC